MAPAVQNGSASRYKQNAELVRHATSADRSCRQAVLLRLVLPAGDEPRQPRRTSTATLPDYNSTRNEGFGKLTVHADQPRCWSTAATATRTRSRHERPVRSGHARRRPAPATSRGRRSSPPDGSWVVNSKSFLSFKFTHFENPTAGVPDNIAERRRRHRRSAHSWTSPTSTRWDCLTRARHRLRATTRPTRSSQPVHRPVRLRRPERREDGRRHGRLSAALFDKRRLLPDAGQVAYNVNSAPSVLHDLHVGYQQYSGLGGPAPQLERMGLDLGSRRAARQRPGRRRRMLLSGGLPAAGDGRGAADPLGVPVAEHRGRTTRSRWQNWSFNVGCCWSATTRSTARASRTRQRRSPATTLATGTTQYKMYDSPLSRRCSSRASARPGRTTGKDTVYASYAKYNPAASSLPRAASWARNLAVTHQRLLRPERRPITATSRTRPRPASCSCRT